MTARRGSGAPHVDALGDALLYLLALRGVASCAPLAGATGAAPPDVERAVEALVDAGLVERVGDRVVLTDGGRARAALVRAREATALREPAGLLYDRFVALNRTVKDLLHRWQVRSDGSVDVPNDHTDAAYDDGVLRELARLERTASALLAPLAALRARYADYLRRLAGAAARAAAGDRRAVAGVTTDSFHAAWWELHADLLAVLGRPRGPDDV